MRSSNSSSTSTCLSWSRKSMSELLITEVDTDLLKTIIVKDLKASNIQATNVLDFLHGWINQSFITFLNNEPEDKLINFTANTSNRAGSTRARLALGDPLSTDLQFWLTEIGDHPLAVNATKVSNLNSI